MDRRRRRGSVPNLEGVPKDEIFERLLQLVAA
jgi:hypothetical protein